MPTSTRDRQASVQVLCKASQLLDRLAEDGELPVARLAELVGEPRSTVHRLVGSLQELDLVEPGSRRGTYRLGLRLLRLGSAVVARFDERRAAIPVMEHLHRQTEETVYLCIRRGYDAVCIERIDGRWVRSMALRLGGALPLHVGAAPRALLAYEPREFWEEYVAREELAEWTPSTPTDPMQLFALLEEIRRTGRSISDEDVTLGMAAVGAPIFGHRGTVCAALSLSGPKPAILGASGPSTCELVVEGAAEISRALGYAGEPAR